MDTNGTILAVVTDLMFSVRIVDIAKRLGLRVALLKDADAVLEKAKNGPVAVILDLNCLAADPIEIIRSLKAHPATHAIPLIGFVSHVQVDLKQKALEAGCDTVLARSVFAEKLPGLLARHAAPERLR